MKIGSKIYAENLKTDIHIKGMLIAWTEEGVILKTANGELTHCSEKIFLLKEAR